MRGRGQVHIGVRFAARHFVPTEDAALKEVMQPHFVQHHFQLVAVRA